MARLIPILVLLVAFAGLTQAQEALGKEIKDRDIEWSDFSGPVDPASRFDAVTNWAIPYRYSAPVMRGDRVYVNATTQTFLRANSWVKPNKQSDRLLDHERGHFKIGRICAREIAATINSTGFDPSTYREEINKVYWAVLRKYLEIEKQYDEETDHYRDRELQARWNKKLDELLIK
jgi:hypothetical protein